VTPAAPVRQLLPRDERRASILRGAADAFARSGFAQTSMDDAATACGVTKLIVYRHFGTKEDLYRAILQRVFDRLGEELDAGLVAGATRGVGARTLLVVAREDPAAFTLLWRHAAREPQFAAYAAELRDISVEVVRQLLAVDTGDEVLDRWRAEALFAWLVEATLTWLDVGDPGRDDDWVEQATVGLRAFRDAWRSNAPVA
jgi:AcrR family transcriptional regulator